MSTGCEKSDTCEACVVPYTAGCRLRGSALWDAALNWQAIDPSTLGSEAVKPTEEAL